MEPKATYRTQGATLTLMCWIPFGQMALAIYSVLICGGSKSYEVQIIRWQNGRRITLNGHTFKTKDKWRHPTNEDFGKFGWS